MPFLPHNYCHLWLWSSRIQSQSENIRGRVSKQFTSFSLYSLLSSLVTSPSAVLLPGMESIPLSGYPLWIWERPFSISHTVVLLTRLPVQVQQCCIQETPVSLSNSPKVQGDAEKAPEHQTKERSVTM